VYHYQGAVELHKGSGGSFVLEWLFSNLVVARRDGDVFVPLAKRIFLRASGGAKPPRIARWISPDEKRGVLKTRGRINY
jgi:hypothetical protein